MYPGSTSVIVCARNNAATLERAMRSVLDQLTGTDELIVVVGPSTDGTGDIAASIDGATVIQQSGDGLASARNEGMARARHDVIGWCDADDYWNPDSLASRRRLLDLGADLVVCRIVRRAIGSDESVLTAAHRLGATPVGWTPTALLGRRSAYDLIGAWSTDLGAGCDTDWFARAMRSTCRIDVDRSVGVTKGVRIDSLSHHPDYARAMVEPMRRHIASLRASVRADRQA